MIGRRLLALVVLVLCGASAEAETLGSILKARGLTPPADLGGLIGQTVAQYQVLDDERDLLVVYSVGSSRSPRLHATRFERGSRTWRTRPLDWRVSSGPGALKALAPDSCRGGLSVGRFPGGFLVNAHINPSAECTVVLSGELAVRAVLAGWPVVALADGRLVYQRNQIHFAPVGPVALALFDPRRLRHVPLYPRAPYQPIRVAHVARMRAVYTDAWCNAHNHPCDPDVFDEHVGGSVVTDARGTTLAFTVAWDNTAGWSDAERWGRLEAFRELREALGRWDGQGEPPADLYRNLSAGLARMRNMKMEALVTAALAGEPELRDLVAAALATRPAAGQDAPGWLRSLDARWADATTWRRLGRAAEVPEEFTEVLYVYTGLDRPGSLAYRELLKRDFEARFGGGAPGRALEPDVVRRLFASHPD